MLLPLALAVLLQDPPQDPPQDAQQDAPQPPRYEVSLHVAPAPLAQVAGRGLLEGLDPARPTQDLYLVRRYAVVSLPEPLLTDTPIARDGQGRDLTVEPLEPYRWRVHKGDAEELELHWRVPVRHREEPAVRRGRAEYQFPYIAADHGLLHTSALVLAPENSGLRESLLTIEAPPGWQVVGPWPQVAPGVFRPGSERALVSNLVAVGAWSRSSLQVDGAQVELLFAPGQEPLPERVLPLVTPLLRAELELFAMRPFERYLLLFGRPDTPGLGGSPKHGSMTLNVAPGLRGEGGVSPLVHLLAHEFFHTWAQARFQAPDELRFFNEGFTDYYARLLPARLGLVPWSDFGEAVERALAAWDQNPRTADLSLQAAGGPPFFADADAYQLTYSGGLALAALCDLALRNQDLRVDGRQGDLDELMRALMNDPRWSPGGRAPGVRHLRLALAERLGHARARRLMALSEATETPDLVAAFREFGVPLERSLEAPSPSLRANLEGMRLVDLDRRGLAARLGLRAGDRLLSINGRELQGPADLRAAWRQLSGQVRLEVQRGEQRLTWERPVPAEVRYRLPLEPWAP